MIVALLASKAAYAQLTPQQKQDIHTHYQQATRAYDLGKYQEAIDEYQKVYEIDGDPVMLYNIAQAYRLNDQPQDSIHFYRRYLQRSPEARNREDVERKIAGQEKLIEERRKAAAAVTPPPISSSKNPPPSVIETKPDTSVTSPPVAPPPVVVVPAAPPPPPSKTRKIVGWSMVGVGVAADVVAIIEGVVAKNRGDELTQMSQSGKMPVFDPSIQSQGKTANIVAIVCGITGTAVAVTGAILLITNGSSSPPAADSPTESGSSPNVSFTPWLAPGLVGGGMGMRF